MILIIQRGIMDKLPTELVEQAKQIKLTAPTALFHKGEKPQYIYFLIHGSITLTRCHEQGSSCILQHIQHGFLAEASLFGREYHCDAIAHSDSELLAFPIALFYQALDKPVFRDFWIQSLSLEIKRLRTQTERLTLKTASERIMHYLEAEGEYSVNHQHKTKKDWAIELGITHEALYRTLAQLKTKHLIVEDAGCIKKSVH
jgi:CRP-like cAMP-binding protein